MQKILKSLLVVGVVSAAVFGSAAYFSDTETSNNNIFVAGAVDLKVDHVRQTYNDLDCQTCNLVVASSTQDMVVKENETDVTPRSAVPVTATWVTDTYWTASIPGASWVWAYDPVSSDEGVNGATYTFEREFSYYGPVIGASLDMGLAADNTYEVYLNDQYVGSDYSENNFQVVDTYNAELAGKIEPGINTLKFVVRNLPLNEGTPTSNPGGLRYKLTINGDCESDYFQQTCRLWQEKDLVDGDTFFNFDDVKPGDHGSNVISLHVDDNPAYICMETKNFSDKEVGDRNEPETTEGDLTDEVGELSPYLKFFAWMDDGDGLWNNDEVSLVGPVTGNVFLNNWTHGLYLPTTPLDPSNTGYLGLMWCFGDMTVVPETKTVSCDGSQESYNMAQTDKVMSDFGFYAEQARHNEQFTCPPVSETQANPSPSPTATPQ